MTPQQPLNYTQANNIIWDPDRYPLEVVAEAAELILSSRRVLSQDVLQAVYLITTFRPR